MTVSSFDRPSRRAVIGAALACSVAPSGAYAAASGGIMAGTYAGEGGKGLVALSPGAVGWIAGSPQAAIANASFGVMGSRHRLRYLLDEQDRGRVGVYDGSLRRLADRSTMGSGPCHAALDPAQTSLAVANYGSGDIALWRLDPTTGLPQGEAQRVAHDGHGPDAGRQAAPHAHWVGFTGDGRILHAVDLGADAIFAHHIDARDGRIGATHVAYRAVAGSGPRHLARHPRLPIAYLVAELNNTVTVLRTRADGTFTAQGVVSTLPAGWSGTSAAAHIALNRAGTRLYVSNRGHDSIAVFAVAADGALTLLQHVGCGGHWPRLFLLLEDRGEVLVANERSGSVASLRIAGDGRLSATSRTVAVQGVAFLAT